jgi:hypothetical protein
MKRLKILFMAVFVLIIFSGFCCASIQPKSSAPPAPVQMQEKENDGSGCALKAILSGWDDKETFILDLDNGARAEIELSGAPRAMIEKIATKIGERVRIEFFLVVTNLGNCRLTIMYFSDKAFDLWECPSK